ncbi:MAG: hypothetical protein ACRELS_12380 [Candidatus Rokuibacteriota bacterium]
MVPRLAPLFAALLVAVIAVAAAPAAAIEYRLQVVSVLDEALRANLAAGEFKDGAAGPGLNRLEATLDAAGLPKGALLYDRHVRPAPEPLARGFGATPVAAQVREGGDERAQWDEARWDGRPGEVTVWLIRTSGVRPQEATRVALKGDGPMRQFLPYTVASGTGRFDAVKISLNYLNFTDGARIAQWTARAVNLKNGIAVVVGVNDNSMRPDDVYLIVEHSHAPATYKAVLGWRQRRGDIESPSSAPIIIK